MNTVRSSVHTVGNIIGVAIFLFFSLSWVGVVLYPNPQSLTLALFSTLLVAIMVVTVKGGEAIADD